MAMTSAASYPRLSSAAMQVSLDAVLSAWNGRKPLWVFGYGSLIWKPDLTFDRRVRARVFGYHRKLCLRSIRNRGTPDYPGLVAGLDRGGSCSGVAYRVPAQAVRQQFTLLWEREMFVGSYAPRWLNCVRLDGKAPIQALAFVVRPDAPNYCGRLPAQEAVDILRCARGVYGSSLEYLQKTVTALHAEGLRDLQLERLLALAHEP